MKRLSRSWWRVLSWTAVVALIAGGVVFLIGAYRQSNLLAYGVLLVTVGMAALFGLLFLGGRRSLPRRRQGDRDIDA
jgi:uncharacterized membrane protein YhaH (DUF805 family)